MCVCAELYCEELNFLSDCVCVFVGVRIDLDEMM